MDATAKINSNKFDEGLALFAHLEQDQTDGPTKAELQALLSQRESELEERTLLLIRSNTVS